MPFPTLPVQGSTAWYPWARDSNTVIASSLQFSVKAYGAIGDGSVDDGPAIQATITAATAAGGAVIVPPGNYRTGQDLTLPQGTPLIGTGSSVTRIYGTVQRRLTITGDSGKWVHLISGLRLDTVGIRAGVTTTDYGRGLTLYDLEILNCDVGVEYRNHCWLTRIYNCRIHDCAIGVYNNFTGVIDSGAAMLIHGSAIFNITGAAFRQDGVAADGAHIQISDTDLEHAGTSIMLRSVGDSSFDVTAGHFELNTASYIDADSGTITVNGTWMFGLEVGSPVALFVLSGTARCLLNSGRVAWETAFPLSKITGTAQLLANPDQLVWQRPWGRILGNIDASPYAAGSVRGVALPAGFTVGVNRSVGTMAPAGLLTLQRLAAFDENTYECQFVAQVTAVGTTNNTLRVFFNPGGATAGAITMPNVTGTCQVRIVVKYDRARIYWTYSNGTGGMVDVAIGHALSVDKFIDLQNNGDQTMTVYDWQMRVLENTAISSV